MNKLKPSGAGGSCFSGAVVAVIALTLCGCSVPGDRAVGPNSSGVARFFLSEVPADVRCVAVVAEGSRNVSKRFSVVSGNAVTLELAGLPLGSVTFSGAAFPSSCDGSTALAPSWVADPVSAILVGGVVASVMLNMHLNGRASVVIDFSDSGGGGSGGGGDPVGTGGGGDVGGSAGTGAPGTGGVPGAGAGPGGGGGGTDGGATGAGGSPTGVDAGTADRPEADATVGADSARDGEQGGTDWCAPASPTDVWTLGAFSAGAIFAFSPTDIWITQGSQILHGDGSTWTMVLDTGQHLGSIWASRPDDIWVGGPYPLHGDGAAFEAVTLPGGPWFLGATFIGLSPTDVWAIGDPHSANKIAHWDGSTWTDRTLPPPPIGGIEVDGLWPVATNDAWAVGSARAGASTIFRWDGRMWQAWPANAIPVADYYSFWGSSASDVWLIGNRGIVHFDGKDWSLVDPTVFSMNGGRILWGSCRTDVWASLPSTTLGYHPQLAHFDGTKWSKLTIDSGPNSTGEITGSGPDDVWVLVGGALKHRRPGSPEAVCGNVRIDLGEQCDPPDGVTCTVNCLRVPGCGDGVIEAGEQCDPPDNYTCGATCQVLPLCGNHRIDPGEQCDPVWSGATCDDHCQIPTCGNGRIDPGENCEPPTFFGWTPGHGSSLYCGPDCKTRDACEECHGSCGTDPVCICSRCSVGIYNPCLSCPRN